MNFYICKTCHKIADIQGEQLQAGKTMKPLSQCGRNLHSWVHAQLSTGAARKTCEKYEETFEEQPND